MRPAAGLALHVVVAMFLFGSASSQGSTPLLREEEEASVGHCNPAYVSIPNALARARALRPPVPVCTYGGEHEANDFWDKNEPLIQQALKELGPLHEEVYAPRQLQDVYRAEVVAALEQPDQTHRIRALRALVEPTNVPGVWALPLLSRDFCHKLLEEMAHLRKSGVPLRRPNGMNRFGAILTSLGFQEGLLEQLARHIVRPLANALYPQWVQGSEVEEVFGFLVRYDLTGDVELAEHADASCVTLNVCLGPEEPGGLGRQGFQGGNLVFRGVRFQDEDASTRPQKAIEHKVGVAILHLGQHLHQAERITKGERENLIMWLTGKGGWVRVRPYSFINATGKWSETPFDEKLSLK